MHFSIFKDRRGTSQSAAQLRVDRTAAIVVSHGGTPYAAATANSTISDIRRRSPPVPQLEIATFHPPTTSIHYCL